MCWRKGCVLMMKNGYDHPGTCHVVTDETRRRGKRPAQAALALEDLSIDLLAHIAAHALALPTLLAWERCSQRLRHSVGASEQLVWRAQLCRMLESVEGLPPSASVSFRAVCRALHRTLEAKGWAQQQACTAGDMHSFWRCRAVALRMLPPASPASTPLGAREMLDGARCVACRCLLARSSDDYALAAPLGERMQASGSTERLGEPRPPAMVRVRYVGYGSADDEWRLPCCLRRAANPPPNHYYATARRVGEPVEVSAKPCARPP